jgi:hypothetical protein
MSLSQNNAQTTSAGTLATNASGKRKLSDEEKQLFEPGINMDATEKNTGRWLDREKKLFEQGFKIHGRNWTAIAASIPGRTAIQVKSHAEKCLRTFGSDYAYLVDKRARAEQILSSNAIKRSSDIYLDPTVQMKYAEVFQANTPSKEGSATAASKTMQDWFATEFKKENQDVDMVIVPV